MSVQLIIKSAAQTVEDFNLDCEVSWTIDKVKSELAELYPTKPKKETQRLIYSGKLLPDHLPLKSVLNHSNEKHIMHLVCPSIPNANIQNDSKQSTSTQSFTVPPNTAFSPMNHPMFNSQNISTMSGINAPVNTGDAFQQYLAMQQMYAQLMSQYMSQYNISVAPYGPLMSAPPVQVPQVQSPQQNRARNPPQRPAEDDNDYLDYFYMFSQALILFAVLYYYSSLGRVLLVVTVFLSISIFVKISRMNQQNHQRNNENQQNESVATRPVPAHIQPSESDEIPASNPLPAEQDSSPPPTENRSFLTTVTTIINLTSAFFSSLIPTEPPPVNAN